MCLNPPQTCYSALRSTYGCDLDTIFAYFYAKLVSPKYWDESQVPVTFRVYSGAVCALRWNILQLTFGGIFPTLIHISLRPALLLAFSTFSSGTQLYPGALQSCRSSFKGMDRQAWPEGLLKGYYDWSSWVCQRCSSHHQFPLWMREQRYLFWSWLKPQRTAQHCTSNKCTQFVPWVREDSLVGCLHSSQGVSGHTA